MNTHFLNLFSEYFKAYYNANSVDMIKHSEDKRFQGTTKPQRMNKVLLLRWYMCIVHFHGVKLEVLLTKGSQLKV